MGVGGGGYGPHGRARMVCGQFVGFSQKYARTFYCYYLYNKIAATLAARSKPETKRSRKQVR